VCYRDDDDDNYGDSITINSTGDTDCQDALESTLNTDCNDSDVNEYPGQTWYVDADADDYSPGSTVVRCDRIANYYVSSELIATTGDCNDANAQEYPGQVWYLDADADDWSNGTTMSQCSDPGSTYYILANLTAATGDCNDANATIYSGATELCDGLDNNCNGQVDDNVTFYDYYQDFDSDSYGNSSVST